MCSRLLRRKTAEKGLFAFELHQWALLVVKNVWNKADDQKNDMSLSMLLWRSLMSFLLVCRHRRRSMNSSVRVVGIIIWRPLIINRLPRWHPLFNLYRNWKNGTSHTELPTEAGGKLLGNIDVCVCVCVYVACVEFKLCPTANNPRWMASMSIQRILRLIKFSLFIDDEGRPEW